MKTARYLSWADIKKHNPCADQYRAAHKLFGKRKRIKVTVAAAVAVADQFYFAWLAEKTLSAQALAEYRRVKAQAWAQAYIRQEGER